MRPNRYVQTYSWVHRRWQKWDRETCRLVETRKEKGKYPGIPVFRAGDGPYKHCIRHCRFIKEGECRYMDLHIKTVAVDFDRTIFHHSGWVGHEQYGEPIEGVREALLELRRMGFKIMIWTTRNQPEIISAALKKHRIPYDYINHNPQQAPEINPTKPAADYYIDDRAVRFVSWPQVVSEIKERDVSDPFR